MRERVFEVAMSKHEVGSVIGWVLIRADQAGSGLPYLLFNNLFPPFRSPESLLRVASVSDAFPRSTATTA